MEPTNPAQWVHIDDVKPWENNPRNNDHAVAHVAKSIERFGWGAPIIARRSDGVIIAGHTRHKAAQHLGMDKVLVRYMDLDPAQSAALALADNKLNELADWNGDQLTEVLQDLADQSFDLSGLGWDESSLDEILNQDSMSFLDEEKYTPKIVPPTYEPKGDNPPTSSLYDTAKTDELLNQISTVEMPEEVAVFLRHAASRHTVFDYEKIAEFYCHASPEVQHLMESSALVIIDFDRAIAEGFVRMTQELAGIAALDGSDA